jgi:sarcosine oxidase subunit gamma
MWNEQHLATPLIGLGNPAGGIRHGKPDSVLLSEQPYIGIVNLRGSLESPAFVAAVRSVVGVEPPAQPNTVAQGDECCVMWLSPDEWMIRSDAGHGVDLPHRLSEALGDEFSAATDQSSGYSVVQLSGPHAAAVLSKGCAMDLHPRAFALGQCAQTMYFKTGVLLRKLDDEGAWEVIVRRSFADYAARILMDAMEEYL